MARQLGSQGAGGWARHSVTGQEVLIIEQQSARNPRRFLEEVRHELTYEAVREAGGVPALATQNVKHLRYANTLLENVIKVGESTWEVLRGFP